MSRDINIKVVFQGKSDLFQCLPSKFIDEVTKRYKVRYRDIDVYAVKKNSRRKISPKEIADFMTIEIVPKGKEPQRSVSSYFEGESSKTESFVEKLITKLKDNAFLTGQDRKYLMEVLQNCANSSLGKRKHEDNSVKLKMVHKKVQAQPTSQFHKESFAQTDLVFVTPDVANAGSYEIISEIKKLSARSEKSQEEINMLMSASFDDRRNFILLKTPLVASVKEKYPLLFCVEEVKNELERLFYLGKCDEFMTNIDKYSNFIMNYCEEYCGESNETYQRTMKLMHCCPTLIQKNYAKAVGSILILPSLLDENLGFLNTSDNKGKSDIYPYIDASLYSLKAVFYDNLLFKIYAEKQLICEATNFKEAILCLMASFYIFNINYPTKCMNTMAIFEKLYLCANETVDLSSTAKKIITYLQLKEKGKEN